MSGGKVFAAHRKSQYGFTLFTVGMLNAIKDCRIYKFWTK